MNIDLAPFWQWLQEQIALALIYMVRPAVQRQIIAIVVVLLVTWLAPKLLDLLLLRLEKRLHDRHQAASAAAELAAGMTLSDVIQATDASAQGEGKRAADKSPDEPRSWQERTVQLVRAVNFVLFPLLALFSFQLLISYFTELGWPHGLIQSVLPFLWLVLGYRLIFSLMLTFLRREDAERTHSHYLRPLVILLLLLVVDGLLFNTLGLGDFELISIQEFTITLGGLTSTLEILSITYLLSWLAFNAVYRLLVRNKAEPGLVETISTVTRYGVLGLGVIVGLGALGVDLATLGWIGTGLSVGIGFGLQELFGNFASGIVLTFERSVRPGDVIESQGLRGVVSQVGMRATIIRTADRSEVFVPNKELMTKPLIAVTYSDRIARVLVNVNVVHGADIDQVNELLLTTITRHPLILGDPGPGAMLTEFGAYSINFIVFGFVAEFNDSFRVKAELYQMVRDALAQQGIALAMPRQDLHIVQETGIKDDLV